MAGKRVVVHDIDSLERFMGVLQSKRNELENLYQVLAAETRSQGDNWQDPQYDYLSNLVNAYCLLGSSQLQDLDGMTSYLAALISRLREI